MPEQLTFTDSLIVCYVIGVVLFALYGVVMLFMAIGRRLTAKHLRRRPVSILNRYDLKGTIRRAMK